MSSTTIKHNLHKIDGTDAPPDITVLNANWDYIDSLLGIASELSSNVIASNTDMNNITKAGLHKCETSTIAATITNSPTNNAFALLVENHASGGYKQTVTEYNTTSPKMWFRNKSADTWSSWIKIYTGVDKPTKSDVGLGNVDNTSDANKPISTATQTALDEKQATITGGASTITTNDLGTSKALISNSSGKVAVSSVNSTELSYLSGVTSAIQTQLNGKIPTTRKINNKELSDDITLSASDVGAQATVTGAATTITDSNLTANRALISNGSGKVAVSAVTSTELGYLDGVTSNIQTQFGNKANHDHNHDALDITSGALPIANGGTGATTANAAATNLYESGTWTPKLICEGTGAVNPTYTHSYNGTAGSPIGRYTRIGNLVYVQCYIPALISAAGTGFAAISGLPYAGSGDMDSTLVNRGYANALNGSVSTLNPVLKVSSGGTTVGYRIPDGSGGYKWKVNTSTSPKGSLIQFAGVYRIG